MLIFYCEMCAVPRRKNCPKGYGFIAICRAWDEVIYADGRWYLIGHRGIFADDGAGSDRGLAITYMTSESRVHIYIYIYAELVYLPRVWLDVLETPRDCR